MSDEGVGVILNSLSCSLRLALEHRQALRIQGRSNLYLANEGKKHVIYTEELIGEAKQVLGEVEILLRPAPRKMVRGWLINLGESVRSTYDQEEARRVIKQLGDDLDFPSFCFTSETRLQAAIHFKWFPKFHELNAFFDELCAEELTLCEVMKAISEMPPTDENGLPLEFSRLKKTWAAFITTIETYAVECSMLAQLQLLEEPDSQVKVKAPSRFLYEQCVEIEGLSKMIRNHFQDKSIVISYGNRRELFDPT